MKFPPRSQRPQTPIFRVRATRAAAEPRANHKLPYTDAFAALAIQRKASLATSDQDFATIEKKIDIL
jgi:predicted nucleic acid-binding protein